MKNNRYIYLDNNATTKLDPEVLKIMLPYFTENYGNPSSRLNVFGRNANVAVENAIYNIVECFEAKSRNDFIFTSGATEANNMAISGVLQNAIKGKMPHIIVSAIEHPSILEVYKYWSFRGVKCTYLPVNREGRIFCENLEESIQPNTCLISIMAANNEIGTIQPLKEIINIAKKHNILVHTDATQYLYNNIINVKELPFNMISFSGHKIHGPKGIGCLYLDSVARERMCPIIFGGGQQNDFRSGTLNVPGIVGLAKALTILKENQKDDNIKIKKLRNLLLKNLKGGEDVYVNGSIEHRLCGNLNLLFPDISALALIGKLPDICISTSSACNSGKGMDSYVLRAIGVEDQGIKSSIRIGLSRFTTKEEIIDTANRILQVINEIKLKKD